MSFTEEFATIDMIAESQLPTRAVDVFALSIIKMERQMRKLFTYLIFQSDDFDYHHVAGLRGVLSDNKRVYFDGFERGIDALYPLSVEQIVGAEYGGLRRIVSDALAVRNKIFHGQLTDHCLLREDLVELATDVRRWCELLAGNAQLELGYDGFGRPSFRKGPLPLSGRYKVQVNCLDSYRDFLARYVQR